MFANRLSALVFVVLMTVSPIAPSAERWNAYTYIPTAEITAGQAMQKITEGITRQSDGALSVRIHFGGSLPIQATNITQAISRGGTIQLADDGFPYGNIPIAGILNLPLLLTNEKDFDVALDIMRPYIARDFDEKGIELLAIYHYPQQVAWSRKKLTSLADLSGTKMRVSSPQQAAFVQAYGGTPITLGTPEVAPALQRGVVDGVFTASSGGARTWEDLLSHNYRLGPNYFASFVIANKAAFDALDAAVRETIRAVAKETAAWATRQMRKEEQKITQQMAQRGMSVTAADPEDIAEGSARMASYWESWAKEQGDDAVKVLEKIRAAIGK